MIRAMVAALAVLAFSSSAYACGFGASQSASGESLLDTAQTSTPVTVDGKSTPAPNTDG